MTLGSFLAKRSLLASSVKASQVDGSLEGKLDKPQRMVKGTVVVGGVQFGGELEVDDWSDGQTVTVIL